jgi:hypothetical protein
MFAVFAVEANDEGIELDVVVFLVRVPLGFLDLPDEAGVQGSPPTSAPGWTPTEHERHRAWPLDAV